MANFTHGSDKTGAVAVYGDARLCGLGRESKAADSPPSSTDSIEFAGGGNKCPIKREVRDIFPTSLPAGVVTAARKQLVCGDSLGVLDVLLKILMLYARWKNMVVASSNEQQRGTIIVGKVICGGCVRCEIREPTLK